MIPEVNSRGAEALSCSFPFSGRRLNGSWSLGTTDQPPASIRPHAAASSRQYFVLNIYPFQATGIASWVSTRSIRRRTVRIVKKQPSRIRPALYRTSARAEPRYHRNDRLLIMSPPYDNRGSSRRRNGAWSHWVPLAVTVTVATVGLAAWLWSQRSNNEDEEEGEDGAAQHLDYEHADYGDNAPYGASGDRASARAPPSFRSELREDEIGYGTTQPDTTASGWGARVSGALRRTPSPQNFLDRAGKTVAAGVAAAGTAVGSALAAIREEDKAAFADHETWSEEADAKKEKSPVSQPRASGNKKRKTIAIVVSADTQLDDVDEVGFHEHAVCFLRKIFSSLTPRTLIQERRPSCHISPNKMTFQGSSCSS